MVVLGFEVGDSAVGAMVGWGLGPVFVKFIHLPGLVLSFHRLWIGALVGLAVLTARGQRLSLQKIWIAAPGAERQGETTSFPFMPGWSSQ